MAPSASMPAAAAMFKSPAKRAEVVEPWLAHVAAEGLLFHVGSGVLRRMSPGLSSGPETKNRNQGDATRPRPFAPEEISLFVILRFIYLFRN